MKKKIMCKMELRKIQEENKKVMDQGARFLLEHQDCLEHYQQKIFSKYCLEQDINRLCNTQMKKEFF
jgi:hypothetical protein